MSCNCPHCGKAVTLAAPSGEPVTPTLPVASPGPSRIVQLQDRAWLATEYAVKSGTQIAAELDCNEKTVMTWVRRHGIASRPPGTKAPGTERRRAERRGAAVVALQAWVTAHGKCPTAAEWGLSRPAGALSETALRDLFGSWTAALQAAGLNRWARDDRMVDKQLEARRAALLAALQDWAVDHDGESPTQAEWMLDRPPGVPRDVRHLFRTWNDALRAAGLKPRKPGEYRVGQEPTPAGKRPDRARQMVTGQGLNDRMPGTVKHFGGS